MILTVLVGNTSTKFAWFGCHGLVAYRVVPTAAVCRDRVPSLGRVAAIAVASVVPGATRAVRTRLRAAAAPRPFVVGPRTRIGLRFRYLRRELGADRVCAAAGARHLFPDRNILVFDFGTATTANVILREGIFAGGAILPGIQMTLDALAAGTAHLPRLRPGRTPRPVQHCTRAAIQAGVATLFAGGIDRTIDRIEHDLGRSFTVLSTGGAVSVARRYSRRLGTPVPHLASEGLAELLYLNRGTEVAES
jgi:type III pantothenate kinase